MTLPLLSLDPGNTQTGWALVERETFKPLVHGKDDNEWLIDQIKYSEDFLSDGVVIEMVASYGMPVGAEVFDTCVWIGRFWEASADRYGVPPSLAYRHPVKLHHCKSSKANDATVKQALVDRFAKGESNYGKGTKALPGWFYGFKADVWSAYAIAVYHIDLENETEQI